MAEYIDRDGAYPLAKKICDAIDSKEFQRLNFGMRILDWIDDIPVADVVLGRDFRECRNELCLRCGDYKQRHLGACDGCRWKDVGE